jgi:hypothetical protein
VWQRNLRKQFGREAVWSPSDLQSTPEMLENLAPTCSGKGAESIMKSAKLQQKRRPAGRKPPPSTRRQGKPRAGQVQKRTAPLGYQISVRGQLPTDLVERVSLLHATALLDLHPQVAQAKGAQREQGEVKLSTKPVAPRS